MIEVFRAKKTGDAKKLRYFVQALYSELQEEERSELHEVISDELRLTEDDADFRLVIQLFPTQPIEQLPEITRLRLENRLIQSLSEGDFNSEAGKLRKGGLGTWIDGWADKMLLQDELQDAIATKFLSRDLDEHAYLCQYFVGTIDVLMAAPSSRLVRSIRSALKLGSEPAKNVVDILVLRSNVKVTELFAKELQEFEAKKPTFDDDEIPF